MARRDVQGAGGESPKPIRTQTFAEVLAEAQPRPGVDPNDPVIAPLLAELSQDPGFVMISFPRDPEAAIAASLAATQALGFGPPPGWTPPEPTTLKVGDHIRWWPNGRPPARKRAEAQGVVEAIGEDGLTVDFRRKDGTLFPSVWAESCELVKTAKR